MRPTYRTLGELRQSLAISLGFGAVSSMVSLQQPMLDELLRQAQDQLWRDVHWRHLLRVHDEALDHNQRVLDIPDDAKTGRVERVFVTADFEAFREFLCEGGPQVTPVDGGFETFPNDELNRPIPAIKYRNPTIKPCAALYELRHGIPRAGVACYGMPKFFEISARYDGNAAQLEFAPIPQGGSGDAKMKPWWWDLEMGGRPYPFTREFMPACMVRIEYYAAPERFIQDNDRASVPDDLILTLAIVMGKAHYRQPDAQLYVDRFDRMLRSAKADNFGAEGEQAAQPRATDDPYLNPVRGI